jgi:signal transduction histidine kinase
VGAVALAALLVLLAVLQYRWAGELSEAEAARLRVSATGRAHELAREFDREITRLVVWFGVDANEARGGDWSALARAYARWQQEAPHPKLLRGVYVLQETETGPPQTLVLDPDAGRVTAGAWPAQLAPLQERFTEFSRRGEGRPGGGRERWERWERSEDDGTLVLPVADPEGARPRFIGLVVMPLDLDYVREVLLPQLARRYLESDGFDYYVEVRGAREDAAPLYASAAYDHGRAEPDANVGLFDVRLDAANRDLLPSTDGARPGTFRRRFGFGGGEGRGPFLGRGPGGGRRGEDGGRWRMLLWNRAGSVPQIVAAARRRNLAVSFGIEILLATAVGLLVTAARRAERLARQQMEFVAGVTHELRTPLAVIRSAGENLADGVVGAAQVRSYGELVRDEGRRLSEMVEQVLELAGTESGYAPSVGPLEVGPLVEAALRSCEPEIRAASVVVETDLPADLPPVRGDAILLGRAVRNLVDNAVKYSGDNRWVRVSVRVVDGDRARAVAITVQDRGLGIASEDLPHIFEPFYRGGEVRARAIRGSGLGLSLVRRIAEGHGGRVAAQSSGSEPGSTFTLTLPVVSEDAG